jgi:hypothetical protein
MDDNEKIVARVHAPQAYFNRLSELSKQQKSYAKFFTSKPEVAIS